MVLQKKSSIKNKQETKRAHGQADGYGNSWTSTILQVTEHFYANCEAVEKDEDGEEEVRQ